MPLTGTSQAERPEIGPPPAVLQLSAFSLADPVSGKPWLRGSVGLSLSAHEQAGRLWQHYRIESFEDLAGAGYRVEALVTAPVYGAGEQPVDADYRTDLPGAVAPTHARHEMEALPMQVVFRFDEPVLPGQDSRAMFVLGDDLAAYGSYGAFVAVVDPAGRRHELGFDSYITFIPEPATAWLLTCGLGLLGVGARAAGRSRTRSQDA
ncbi:MAG: hypothetical protein HYZ20_02450 [Burkholderiales bacterium]|nr:hypothetical protein [Burkholderiales bacterium]